jgi:hypothetical protein
VNWELLLQQLRWGWLRHRRWMPVVASASVFSLHFFRSRVLRISLLSISVLLFFLVVSDIAQEFLDRSYSRFDGPSRKVAVTPAEILLAAILAFVYTLLIALGLNLLFLPSPITVFVMLPGVFLICCFVAWHNVTLWYEQGAEFEAELRELYREEQQRVSARS